MRGYEAKVSYEGTAQVKLNLKYEKNDKCDAFKKMTKIYVLQYPDSPDFVPSPYGPPEPVKQGERKFKRQSRPVVGVDNSNRSSLIIFNRRCESQTTRLSGEKLSPMLRTHF